MNKILKPGFVAMLALITFSAAYYFVFFLPQQKQKADDFSKSQECYSYAEEIKSKYQKENQEFYDRVVSYSLERYSKHLTEIFYSPKLNSCVIDVLVNSADVTGGETAYHVIIDLLSNKTLGTFILSDEGSLAKILYNTPEELKEKELLLEKNKEDYAKKLLELK